ncbi:MAG TPA: LytTR family DNA-binding domain-containing protein [Flavipsychrobacter sp.]|nr:LytTR family DNA-binding domain-containing protein [Flavipsychrobacter sp.]
MIKAVIIDDELQSRNILSALVSKYCEGVKVEGEACNVANGIELIQERDPDLIFLDIAMPDGTGFDVLGSLEDEAPEVIFITAYNEYALQAIKANATDYILKPVNIFELQSAVKKASDRIIGKRNMDTAMALLRGNRQNNANPGKIAIPDSEGLRFIDMERIIYLEAKGTYTEFFCTGGNKYLSSKPLKEYENILPQEQFFRAHHSYVINLRFIQNYHKGNGGYVTMAEGAVIGIAKRKKRQFLEIFHA